MTDYTQESVSSIQSIRIICRGVFIELMRKKDLFVLLILMLLYIIGIIVINLVGIQNPSTGTFLFNLGMTLAYYCAHVLTLVLTANQIPTEIENRTIYPLLAKPLERQVFIIGKWISCTLCGVLVFIILFALCWLFTPKMENYDGILLFQALILQVISLGMLASLSLLLSLLLPKGLNIVLLGLFLAFSNKIIGFFEARCLYTNLEKPVEWVLSYLPDFYKLNLITRYTDGIGPLGFHEFMGLIFYGVVFTIFSIVLAVCIFHRKPL